MKIRLLLYKMFHPIVQIVNPIFESDSKTGITFTAMVVVTLFIERKFCLCCYQSHSNQVLGCIVIFLCNKIGPQKLLIIGPNFFYSTARLPKPAHNWFFILWICPKTHLSPYLWSMQDLLKMTLIVMRLDTYVDAKHLRLISYYAS